MPTGNKQHSLSKPTFEFDAGPLSAKEVNMSHLGGNNVDHLDMYSGTAPFNKRPRGISINLLD